MSGTEPTPRPRPFESAKITDAHRAKLAVVYVRQSTPQQVAENRESLARQYALAEHARAPGWPAERVPRPPALGTGDHPAEFARSTPVRRSSRRGIL